MKRLLLLFLAVVSLAEARQRWTMWKTIAAGGTPVLVAHVAAAGGTNGGDTTANPVNTTGANLEIICSDWYNGSTASVTPADSFSNTWAPLTPISYGPGGIFTLQCWYCFNPTVGAGQTFSIAGSTTFSGLCVQAWSGISASPLDQQNSGSAAPATTVQPGSITPSVARSVLISAAGFNDNSGTASIDSGFAISDQVMWVSGNNEGCSLASKVVTASSATNPTWTSTTAATALGATIANFKYP